VPRRNLIPLALLAVLALATAGFAVLGASSAPSGATVTVQNASTETFGSPTGSTSFAMDLVSTLSAGAGTGTIAQVRLIAYVPPARMAVYQVSARTTRPLAVLDPAAITCALSAYTAIVGGATPWTPSDGAYIRTESLADYSSRVPRSSGATCTPQTADVHGQVLERAVVRADYLVSVRLTVVVPPQRLSNGTEAAHGAEGEALVLLRINGTPTSKLGS